MSSTSTFTSATQADYLLAAAHVCIRSSSPSPSPPRPPQSSPPQLLLTTSSHPHSPSQPSTSSTNKKETKKSSTHDPVNTPSLISINNKLLPPGSTFQVVTLANGEKVPTGTVAAFLFNLKAYDEICAAESAESDEVDVQKESQERMTNVDKKEKEKRKEKKRNIEEEIRTSLPMLNKLGLFDLFTVEEWGADGARAGRKFVAEEARRYGW